MKTQFERLQSKIINLNTQQLAEAVIELVDDILNTDTSLLNISKVRSGYGTYKSACFANEYHFGDVLADLIRAAIDGRITHDEDKEFTVAEFDEALNDIIFEYLYF